jgi:uncharacterized protein (TIGR03435 family)
MKVAALALVLAIVAAGVAGAQAAETFEVASVKANTTAGVTANIVVDPGRFVATGVALADLIRYAYGFSSLTSQSQVVGGPSWITSSRFDIVATSKGLPSLAMLKALLEDRFKVAGHIESRETPAYLLLVDRADGRLGPAIHPSTSTCGGPGGTIPPTSSSANTRCGIRGRPGAYTADGTNMAQLARALGNFPAIGRSVVDRTGLTGVFDWTLEWTPLGNAAAETGTSIFTALREQLGLTLQPQRVPVDVLVVDRAELPSPD